MNESLCRVGYDTVIYAGTKYTLHEFVGGAELKALNSGDIFAFAAADGLYYILLKNRVAYFFTTFAMFSNIVAKYATIIGAVTLVNFLFDRKERILDNLINIGASGAVSEAVAYVLGNDKLPAP